MENPLEMDDLGVPPFQETPISNLHFCSAMSEEKGWNQLGLNRFKGSEPIQAPYSCKTTKVSPAGSCQGCCCLKLLFKLSTVTRKRWTRMCFDLFPTCTRFQSGVAHIQPLSSCFPTMHSVQHLVSGCIC